VGEPIATVGNLAGVCGHDGTDWIKLLVDEDGKLQITVDTSGLPSGAATSANQVTMITALQLIDDLRNALDSVGTDELDVNVEASVLPTGAATSANQATEITALQSIQNLVGALHDVGIDELDINIVSQSADVEVKQTTPADLVVAQHQYDGSAWRKSNLLWGYNSRLVETLSGTTIADDNTLITTAVPAGGLCQIMIRKDADEYGWIFSESVDPYTALGVTVGSWPLEEGDVLRGYFRSMAADKSIFFAIWGYIMDVTM